MTKENNNNKCDDEKYYCVGRDKCGFYDEKTGDCKFWEIYPEGIPNK